MTGGPESPDPRGESSRANCRSRPKPSGKVRVLFGAAGWPCGVLEIASWAKHQRLAEPVVVHLQPGYAFRLEPDDRQHLAEGCVDVELVDSFARHGRRLSDDSCVSHTGRNTWEIHDCRRGWTYRLVDVGEGLDVYILENLAAEEFLRAIRRFAEARSDSGRFFGKDGSLGAVTEQRGDCPDFRAARTGLSPSETGKLFCYGSLNSTTRDALAAVGGAFLKKLIEFAPHVVGFRLEGGQVEHVKSYIRAVRLFSEAEIVLGGPTPTSHPQDVLNETGADYVFTGEAEEPFNQFLQLAWERNSKDRQPEIPGLAYRYADRVYVNTLPRDGYELSALEVDGTICGSTLRCLRNAVRPVAAAELIAANGLDWSLLEGFDKAEFDSLFFTGGRGCPGACTFCAKLHGPEVRAKSARQLLEEIEAADAKVADGTIAVTRWDLFKHVDDPALRHKQVVWAAVYDEDFFLNRKRAIEFFRLWDQSPLNERYRLSLQTNPCSMLTSDGQLHAELLGWIDRLKPMVQLGAESFNSELLARWHKRHSVGQLNTVLDALDSTRQDYTVFQLLTDFDTTPEELVETLRLLILNAYKRRRMRIASSPFTIPLYDSDTRKLLEYRGSLTPERVGHFTDYERPQPGWMDPLAAELADLADAELRFTLQPEHRDGALQSALEVVLSRIGEERQRVEHDRTSNHGQKCRIRHLHDQARHAMGQIKEARFQAIGPFGS